MRSSEPAIPGEVVRAGRRLGLLGVEERATQLGGSLDVRIPLPREATLDHD